MSKYFSRHLLIIIVSHHIILEFSIQDIIEILVSGLALFCRLRVVICVIHLFERILQLVHFTKSFDLIIPNLPFVTVENVMLEHEYEVEEHREYRKQELNNIEARI